MELPAERRTNQWLADRLTMLRAQYFPDVSIENKIVVLFGRASRARFGSIIAKKDPQEALPVTYITINGLFRDTALPDFVIDATLVHEFVHYTHGFHSPRRQQYPHPHQGGVVTKEMQDRGAGELYLTQKRWVKDRYRDFLLKHAAELPQRPSRRPTRRRLAHFW